MVSGAERAICPEKRAPWVWKPRMGLASDSSCSSPPAPHPRLGTAPRHRICLQKSDVVSVLLSPQVPIDLETVTPRGRVAALLSPPQRRGTDSYSWLHAGSLTLFRPCVELFGSCFFFGMGLLPPLSGSRLGAQHALGFHPCSLLQISGPRDASLAFDPSYLFLVIF